ncbi:hypothetical protein RFZ55_12855, partial [Acinetobacter baumannii]|nr:hypothetical protein [Acinetobacter baumannii]
MVIGGSVGLWFIFGVFENYSVYSFIHGAVNVPQGERRESRVTNAQKGHFAKAGVAAGRLVKEFRVTEAELEDEPSLTHYFTGLSCQFKRLNVMQKCGSAMIP